MRSYDILHTAKILLRLCELCLAVAALAWAATRLPFAVQISGDFLRRLFSVVCSRLFVLLLSNAIIAALFFTASRFSGGCGGSGGNAGKVNEPYHVTSSETAPSHPPPPPHKFLLLENNETEGNSNGNGNGNGGGEEIVYEDKEVISSSEVNVECDCDSDSDSDSGFDGVRVYRRTKSEKGKMILKSKKKLRRAETAEKVRSAVAAAEEEEEEMSDEEFQRAVEKFIEKHLKFRRQESLSLVVQNQREI